ncbi:MAG: FAD-binding oxidoreductase [Verrucomicrobia bacterium]|nr:FAD-binding oxidoreductase [Verrucomicrobiota bacterium]MBI3867259.1 FAD-binding oxidoreductase [Verrucomicrobiota bacterium]
MNRRRFLKSAAAIPVLAGACSELTRTSAAAASNPPASRVRPTDPLWPSEASWDVLRREVQGRLIRVSSPLAACQQSPLDASCREALQQLKNPYYIGDQPALTQTSGWVDAWMSAPSVYAVAAASTEDVVAAVRFAKEHNLRLVVKGGGHSYLGTSNAPDSLLIWTRAMNSVAVHDAFVGRGCAGRQAPQPAVTVGSGAIWMQAYDAVTTRAGRYVQGGGCTTVGVAGLVQSGGFGSFSKRYGTAAAGLLEAEVVTADGVVRTANACQNPDLFWGIKGGGGGSLGVVTRLTLRTRELPERFGGVFGTIKAGSDAAFRKLTARIIAFYHDQLFNPRWGEQIIFRKNAVSISMVFQGIDRSQAEAVWRPFVDWVWRASGDFAFDPPFRFVDIPARHFWDAPYLLKNHPELVVADGRPGAPEGNLIWRGDRGQVGWFVHGYRSAWLPASLLHKDRQRSLADALFASARSWDVGLHFNKGLAGASADDLAAAKDTAMNPAALDAFALAIIAGGGPPAFPGAPGDKPDLEDARRAARKINKSMEPLMRLSAARGSYVSESDFFERSWQRSYWGSNYPRLAAVKRKYDPSGLFFVHHGVGSEEWSADGFTRSATRSAAVGS